jgi:thiosulfate/3-mercaptopyruvate sulfurtransferase
MSDPLPQDLATTAWLAAHLGEPDLRLLDCTFFVPPTDRDARAEFAAAHIPGASYFDVDAVSDHDSPLPHMLPPAGDFAVAVGALGIGNTDRVVVYDNHLTMGAARAWWMFRVFGHTRIAVLDGGLAKWRREARPLSDAAAMPPPTRFTPRFDASLVRTKRQLEENLATGREWVVDARTAGRFEGREPEPRPGLRRGHIEGSINVPFASLLDPNDGTMLPPEALKARFTAAGVPLSAAVVLTCGSGVSACVVALALHRLGNTRAAVYDGSWAEWGASVP